MLLHKIKEDIKETNISYWFCMRHTKYIKVNNIMMETIFSHSRVYHPCFILCFGYWIIKKWKWQKINQLGLKIFILLSGKYILHQKKEHENDSVIETTSKNNTTIGTTMTITALDFSQVPAKAKIYMLLKIN